MAVLEYLYQNPTVLAALIAIIYAVVSTYRATHNIREALLALMLRAEKAYNQGEFGPIAKAELLDKVVDKTIEKVVPKLPVWLRPFFTRERLLTLGLNLYMYAKDYLDDGKFNQSVRRE